MIDKDRVRCLHFRGRRQIWPVPFSLRPGRAARVGGPSLRLESFSPWASPASLRHNLISTLTRNAQLHFAQLMGLKEPDSRHGARASWATTGSDLRGIKDDPRFPLRSTNCSWLNSLEEYSNTSGEQKSQHRSWLGDIFQNHGSNEIKKVKNFRRKIWKKLSCTRQFYDSGKVPGCGTAHLFVSVDVTHGRQLILIYRLVIDSYWAWRR